MMGAAKPPVIRKPPAATAKFDQTRLPGGTVHKLFRAATTAGGRVYRTLCGRDLNASAGAVLTTHKVGCCHCEAAQKVMA